MALEYSLRAAERARATHGTDLAIELYHRAIELLPAGQLDKRREIVEKLADLHCLSGSYPAALERYDGLLAGAPAAERARLLNKLGQLHAQRGEYRTAIERLRQTLALHGRTYPQRAFGFAVRFAGALLRHLWRRLRGVRRRAPAAERARLREVSSTYLRLAYVYLFVDPVHMIYSLLQSVAAGERLGPSQELCRAYDFLSIAYALINMRPTALRFSERARDLAIRFGSAVDRAAVRSHQGLIRMCGVELDAAVEGFRAARDDLLMHGDMWELGASTAGLADARYLQGDVVSALATARGAFQLMERTGSEVFGRILAGNLAFLLGASGEIDEALRYADRAEKLAEIAGDDLGIAYAKMSRGVALWANGRLPDADEALEASVADILGGGMKLDMLGQALPCGSRDFASNRGWLARPRSVETKGG